MTGDRTAGDALLQAAGAAGGLGRPDRTPAPSPVPAGGFPSPRQPVPPTPPPSPVRPGWYRRRWEELTAPQRRRTGEALAGGLRMPLVEPDPQGDPGYRLVTFLHRDVDASAVILSANGLLDHRDPAAMEFDRLPGAGLWALTLRMPADWEAGYRITVHSGPDAPPWRVVGADRRTVRLAADAGGVDPLNPAVGATMNGAAQSLLRLPAAPDAPWLAAATPAQAQRLAARTHPATAVGASVAAALPSVMGAAAPGADITTPDAGPDSRLRQLRVRDTTGGRERLVWLYLPQAHRRGAAGGAVPAATGRSERLPLVLLHDGQVWAKWLNLAATLDAAVSAGVLPPLAVAMIDSLDVPTRTRELSGPTGTVDFLARDLLPLLRSRFPVTADRSRTVVCGASYGGLAALWQLARFPELVGAALAQSPSLWRYDLAAPLSPVAGRVRIRLQAGIYESTVHEPSAALARTLADVGADLGFRSITGGHDWAWWHPWLVRGLAELLGGGAAADSGPSGSPAPAGPGRAGAVGSAQLSV